MKRDAVVLQSGYGERQLPTSSRECSLLAHLWQGPFEGLGACYLSYSTSMYPPTPHQSSSVSGFFG
jgi:hypothetical protein